MFNALILRMQSGRNLKHLVHIRERSSESALRPKAGSTSFKSSALVLSGRVEIKKNGELVAQGSNLVTLSGRTLVAAIVSPPGATKPTHFAIGSDGTPTDDAQTALLAEIAATRQAFAGHTLVGPFLGYNAVITIPAPCSMREIGIFNAAVGGTMLARFITPSIVSLNTADTLSINWEIEFGA